MSTLSSRRDRLGTKESADTVSGLLDEAIKEVEGLHGVTSRELDVQIAERVMGWRKCGAGKSGEGLEIPHYSTSISDAWLVVEEMRRRSFCITCTQDFADELYDVFFWHEENGETQGFLRGALPEAICRAALNAVVDKEK